MVQRLSLYDECVEQMFVRQPISILRKYLLQSYHRQFDLVLLKLNFIVIFQILLISKIPINYMLQILFEITGRETNYSKEEFLLNDITVLDAEMSRKFSQSEMSRVPELSCQDNLVEIVL